MHYRKYEGGPLNWREPEMVPTEPEPRYLEGPGGTLYRFASDDGAQVRTITYVFDPSMSYPGSAERGVTVAG